MEFLSTWIPRIISGIISIMDASNLRNRVAQIEDEHELMWTALDDIARMYRDHPAGKFAKDAVDKIKNKYGR